MNGLMNGLGLIEDWMGWDVGCLDLMSLILSIVAV